MEDNETASSQAAMQSQTSADNHTPPGSLVYSQLTLSALVTLSRGFMLK